MKNIQVYLILSVTSLLTLFASGCGINSNIDGAFNKAMKDPDPVSNTVELTPAPTQNITSVQIQFRGPEAQSDALIQAESSSDFRLRFDAEGKEVGEIQKFLSGSIIEQIQNKMVITVGDRRVTCVESNGTGGRGIRGICVRKLTVYIPAGLQVNMNQEGSTKSILLNVGDTIKVGDL